jgi:hypothetical protein
LTKQVKDGTIHFLSIDVEGSDCDVLMEGSNALKRVEHLDFEQHGVPPWDKHPLSSSTICPLDGLELTCCWAGKDELWRMTCHHRPQHDGHSWSNVACVVLNGTRISGTNGMKAPLETIDFVKVA